MSSIQNSEFTIHKLDDKDNIIASYSGASADKLEKGSIIYIEMLSSMSESLGMKEELTESQNDTFLISFEGQPKKQSKKFKGIIYNCEINPFNCERVSFEAKIKIVSDLESL